ncbi:aminopeptidase [Rhizina undulata]
MHSYSELDFALTANSSTLSSLLADKKTVPLKLIMHRLRVFKSAPEVKNMRTAGRISGRAYNEAMSKRFTTEKALWSFLEYRFKEGGCDGSAYVPVVAGGENSLSIHCTRNDDLLRDGEMVLVNASGEYGGYIMDITRTWPVNGKFTPAQRDLYQAVLNVQRHCVSLCRENAKLSLDDIHTTAEQGLERELKDLGFDLRGRALIEILFPHYVGHFIGLDVHDSGNDSRGLPLRAGQCITVEPGIYVPDDERWPKHFRKMGIRIEDSICVGEEGPIVLSVEAVKEVADIEALGEKH